MKIVTAGMYRSGTTYQFNVIRVLMEEAYSKSNVYSCWVDDYKPSGKKIEIIKAHRLIGRTNEIINHHDYLVSTYRDSSEIKASMRRRSDYLKDHPDERFTKEADVSRFDEFMQSARVFMSQADYIQKFDDIGTVRLIQEYIELFGLHLNPEYILSKINEIKPPKKGIDPVTLFHEGHITT